MENSKHHDSVTKINSADEVIGNKVKNLQIHDDDQFQVFEMLLETGLNLSLFPRMNVVPIKSE